MQHICWEAETSRYFLDSLDVSVSFFKHGPFTQMLGVSAAQGGAVSRESLPCIRIQAEAELSSQTALPAKIAASRDVQRQRMLRT